MSMYYLSEYSDNYSMALGRLWNHYIFEKNDSANENNDKNSQINLLSIRQNQ